MIALEVRDLIVEVGGKIVVEGLSFDLRPGDKVGVVGRNGAGKTSTMKVLTGEAEPAGGSVLRRGSVGYLRQDPRQHRAEDDDLALEHILAARGLVELAAASRRRGIALCRVARRTRRSAGSHVWRRSTRCSAAIRPSRRRRRSWPASACRRTVSSCP